MDGELQANFDVITYPWFKKAPGIVGWDGLILFIHSIW